MTTTPGAALVTGGNGGLAQAISRIWSSAGWDVLAPSRAELDAADPESLTRYFATAERIDVLHLAAGACADVPFLRMTESHWDRVMRDNLKNAFLTAKAAVPFLKRTGGHVIFYSSHSARTGRLGQANYAAAKAALLGLTQSLARELGPFGIRCNAVFPGFMDTGMTEHLGKSAREDILKDHLLPRRNTPEQIASFLLALHHLPGVSGQIFTLDSRILPWV